MSQTSVLRAYDEIAAFFARGPSVEEIASFRLSDQTIERVRELLEKNSAGSITPEEREELAEVGHLNRMLLLIRSRIPRPGTANHRPTDGPAPAAWDDNVGPADA